LAVLDPLGTGQRLTFWGSDDCGRIEYQMRRWPQASHCSI
jgi:hypothetical protein